MRHHLSGIAGKIQEQVEFLGRQVNEFSKHSYRMSRSIYYEIAGLDGVGGSFRSSPKMGPDWIRTSDIAVIDEDAFLFHRGRADGAIMRGGFKMLPETIEHALLLHPAISAAGVVGLPDKRLGQVPAAAIQLKQGAEPPTEAALESHLRGHVYATHIPVAWRFVPELPRTVSLKIDRLALRQLFET